MLGVRRSRRGGFVADNCQWYTAVGRMLYQLVGNATLECL
jgi:hypothetical protein